MKLPSRFAGAVALVLLLGGQTLGAHGAMADTGTEATLFSSAEPGHGYLTVRVNLDATDPHVLLDAFAVNPQAPAREASNNDPDTGVQHLGILLFGSDGLPVDTSGLAIYVEDQYNWTRTTQSPAWQADVKSDAFGVQELGGSQPKMNGTEHLLVQINHPVLLQWGLAPIQGTYYLVVYEMGEAEEWGANVTGAPGASASQTASGTTTFFYTTDDFVSPLHVSVAAPAPDVLPGASARADVQSTIRIHATNSILANFHQLDCASWCPSALGRDTCLQVDQHCVLTIHSRPEFSPYDHLTIDRDGQTVRTCDTGLPYEYGTKSLGAAPANCRVAGAGGDWDFTATGLGESTQYAGSSLLLYGIYDVQLGI